MVSIRSYQDDDLNYMPDVHRAALRRGRRFAYVLTFMTFISAGTLGVWAHYAVLDEVTRGEGKVIPSSKTQVIQNLEGGILSELLVREGEIVEPDTVLIRIDNTAAESNRRELEGRYYSLRAAVARLEAAIEGRDDVKSPDDVMAEAPDKAADQRRLFNARKAQLDVQVSVLEADKNQRQQEINELVSRRNTLQQSLRLAREELNITRPLVTKGVMPRLDLIRIERQVSDLEGEIKTISSSIPRAQAAFKGAERRVEELVLSMRVEMSDELNQTRTELNSVSETLFASTDRVTRTEVRSPVRGTVKELKFNTIGGVIPPGADIIEIVPLDDSLLIEAQVRPADIAFLRPGQDAIIKISAYDFSIYGGLKANLEQISADTIKDENGDSFYRVYLRTEKNSLERHGEKLPIIPGMTATAEILTGEKTVLEYLLKPILKARDRALRER